MNVSDPAAVDPKMTANLLQEHGITATGSLVRFVYVGVPCADLRSAHFWFAQTLARARPPTLRLAVTLPILLLGPPAVRGASGATFKATAAAA